MGCGCNIPRDPCVSSHRYLAAAQVHVRFSVEPGQRVISTSLERRKITLTSSTTLRSFSGAVPFSGSGKPRNRVGLVAREDGCVY